MKVKTVKTAIVMGIILAVQSTVILVARKKRTMKQLLNLVQSLDLRALH